MSACGSGAGPLPSAGCVAMAQARARNRREVTGRGVRNALLQNGKNPPCGGFLSKRNARRAIT